MNSKTWRALGAAALSGFLATPQLISAAPQDFAVTTIISSSDASQETQLTGMSYYPTGIAVDSVGNLFISTQNSAIYKVSPTGVKHLFAGQAGMTGSQDGIGTAARFNYLTGLAIDAADNLYVSDTFNYTIRKITPDGNVSTFAGTAHSSGNQDGPPGIATLNAPWGLAIDRHGYLYVAQNGSRLIRKISPTGNVTTLASIPGGGQIENGITVDAADNVYVSAIPAIGIPESPPPPANFITKVSPAGLVTIFAGQAAAGSADGIGTAALFNGPRALAAEPSGNILVLDNAGMREMTPDGVVTTVIASSRAYQQEPDGIGAQGQLYAAQSLAVDAYGNVFVIGPPTAASLRRCIRLTNSQSPARLLNLSALATVAPGAPFSSGFVVQGPASETLLIRAVGPSLQQFGVNGTLTNPQLTLYTQAGTRVASTADGMNATNSQSAASIVGAFPLPAKSTDAAMVITLGPGVYSAQVNSSTAESGKTLLEVYEVP